MPIRLIHKSETASGLSVFDARITGMFESFDDEFAALVATLPEAPDLPEPDWSEHPVYAELTSPAERLLQLLDLPPAARPTGELAQFDPHQLPDGARIDLLRLLEQQKHWLDSVQQRVLAEIEAADTSELALSQEAVSLALTVPVRTAQAKLKTASLLVRELPDTLALLRGPGRSPTGTPRWSASRPGRCLPSGWPSSRRWRWPGRPTRP